VTGGAPAVLLPAAGTLVLLVALADVFLTVLFPASGHGPLSRAIWWGFRSLARRLPTARRRGLLAYCGPLLVALSIAVWPLLLVVGWALVYLPALGTGLVASSGPTARTWADAVYVSGFSLTTLGTGDVVPTTGLYRVLVVLEAAIGFAVVGMVVSYFLSVYSAITQRKTFAASLDHRTGRTGDSARLVTGLAAQGGLSAVVGQLSSTGEVLERMFQTHQSYPVLRWFHYREVRYALPRILLVVLDAAALVPSALDTGRGPGDELPAVALIDGAAQDLLQDLVPAASARPRGPGDDAAWRARFADAVVAFRRAGLPVREDPDAVEDYLRRRRNWDEPLLALAGAMLYEWSEIRPGPCPRGWSVDSAR
jgi:hypothetical protein